MIALQALRKPALVGGLMFAGTMVTNTALAIDLAGVHDGSAPSRDQIDLIAKSRLLLKEADFADNFASGSLDRSMYNRSEAIREIENGQLRAMTRAYNTTAGVNYTRTNNWVLNSESHSSVSADITITDLQFGSENHPAFANVGGSFYDSTSGDDGATGWVFAQVKFGAKGEGLEIWGALGTSLDAGFNQEEAQNPVTLVPPGVLAVGDTVRVTLEYNGRNSFNISAMILSDGGGTTNYQSSMTGPTRVTSVNSRKRVGTGVDWDDSGGVVDSSVVAVDAYFDNVQTNGFVRDQFSDTYIDDSQWQDVEEYRVVTPYDGNNALRMDAIGDGSDRSTRLEIKDTTDYVETEMMVSSDSTMASDARGRLRIQGHWFNTQGNSSDQIGDVYAHVQMDRGTDGGIDVTWYMGECTDATCNSETRIDGGSFGTAQYDTWYPASIQYTGSEMVFEFDGEEVRRTVAGGSDAFYPTKVVRSRISGGEGRFVTYIDNLKADELAQFGEEEDASTDTDTDSDTDQSGDTVEDTGSGGGAAFALLLAGLFGVARQRRR